MSSPIHHPKDLDAVLMYAPPWVRQQGSREPLRPSAMLAQERKRRRPIALSVHEYSGDRDMARLQRQLALNPERTPEPPVETVRSLLPMVGRLCGVGCVAAAVAWVVISYPHMRFVRSEAAAVAALAAQPEIVAPKADPLRTEAGAGLLLQHGLAAMPSVPPPADNQQIAASPPAHSVETVPVPVTSPVAVVLPVAASPDADHFATENKAALSGSDHPLSDNKPVLLDSDEIATLLRRGKAAFNDGDLAAARLLFRHAADGGSAEAAFALGTTFDPVVLRQIHAVGAEANPARAREWYGKAAQLGSPAAVEKLARLSQ